MSIQNRLREDGVSSVQFCGLILAYVGVALCLQLVKEGTLIHQFCSASCDTVLHSRYSHIAGIPLSKAGFWFYAFEVIYFTVNIAYLSRKPGIAVVGINVMAVLTSAILMWMQFFVLHGFCVFCTLSAAVAVGLCAVSFAMMRSGWVRMPFTVTALSIPLISSTLAMTLLDVKPQKRILATIGNDAITDDEAERELRISLQPIREAVYSLKAAWLDETIFARLTKRQAAMEGKTQDEVVRALLKVDVRQSMVDEELKRMSLPPDANNVEWAKAAVAREEEKRIKIQYLKAKKEENQFELFYYRPLAQVTQFEPKLAHYMGAKHARIQLTVFSDFQCPFCSQLAPILKEIVVKYPEDVSVAFRYYPIGSHNRALRAAAAAEAAALQGKFWEYQDELFKDALDLSDERLMHAAQVVGLDTQEFKKAIDSETAKGFVRASYDDAVKLGIDSAPTLFLNGVMIGGVVDPVTLEQDVLKVLSGTPAEQIDPFANSSPK